MGRSISTASENSKLQVVTVSANTTLTNADNNKFFICTPTAPITITLPTAAATDEGFNFTIYNQSSFTVLITRSGADTINGNSVLVELYKAAKIVKTTSTNFAFAE